MLCFMFSDAKVGEMSQEGFAVRFKLLCCKVHELKSPAIYARLISYCIYPVGGMPYFSL